MTLTEIEKLAERVDNETGERWAGQLAEATLTLCKLVKVQREALEKYKGVKVFVGTPTAHGEQTRWTEQLVADAALAAGDALGVG